MRPLPVFLLTLVAIALALTGMPQVAAHGETRPGFPHVNPMALELDPGKRRTVDLSFEEGAFQEGWVFLVNARVTNGTDTVLIELLQDYLYPVLSWELPADGALHTLSGRIPATDNYALSFLNDGENVTEIIYYYDQSCNCAQKPIPVETPEGVVVFQIDPHAGDEWKATILEPPAYDLKIHLAVREDDASVWPEDFRILSTSDTTGPDPSGREAHVFDIVAEEKETHYFFAEVVGHHAEEVDRSAQGAFFASIMIVPIFERTGGVAETAPVAWFPVAVFAVVAVAVARRRS